MISRGHLIQGDWGRGMHHDGGDWHWIVMLAVLAAFVGLAVWLIATVARRPVGPPPGFSAPPPPHAPGQHAAGQQLAGAPQHPGPRLSAEEILAERLAHGDIEVEDYHRRLEALHKTRPTPPAQP